MARANFVDVVIVGAGLSGIGSARHLQRDCPGSHLYLLESRAALEVPGIYSGIPAYVRTAICTHWVTPLSPG